MTDAAVRDPLTPGRIYLTEGGTETELMYRHGHELPEFAAFVLLDDSRAREDMRGLFARYLDAVAEAGCCALMSGIDYRASPDWAAKLGYDGAALAEMQERCIDLLREVAKPYEGQIDEVLIAGSIGPRGDAYGTGGEITAEQAQEYHAHQLATLARCGVDMAWGATMNNVPEAVGLARAAAAAGMPLNLSFTLASDHRLSSGPSLREAVERVDAEAGEGRPHSYGINCSHPSEFEPALEAGDWFGRVRSIRPNAAAMDKISLCKLGHIEDGDPEELAGQMADLARRAPHVDVWGGCCGTWAPHLRRIGTAVRAVRERTGVREPA